jgi:hypothetical protein
MVTVEIDSNAILVEPLKCRKDTELVRSYNTLLLQLPQAGIVPQKHVMDNEISETMKNHIHDKCKLTSELVLPGCHRCNAAEVALHNFKSHLLSVLAGVTDDFPPSLWDRLLPQTEITLNLLRQSNALPNILAYAHLNGPFTYNKMPLAPMGCEVQVHEKGQTNKGHGHTIPSMGGIYQHHLTTIAHTYATSKTPIATGCWILSISNTSISC